MQKKYSRLFLRMRAELEGNYRFRHDLLRSLAIEMIHEVQKHQPDGQTINAVSNSHERIGMAFRKLLERQFPIVVSSQQLQIHTPSVFADKLDIHVNHLNKALKSTTEKTTSEWINNRMITESMLLLKSSKLDDF